MIVNLIENSIIKVDGEEINVGDLAIYQNNSFYPLFYISGDYTLWTPKGQIRNNYYDLGGEIIAEFEFKSPEYISFRDITIFRPYLKANITRDIPITLYQGLTNQTLKIPDCLVYNLVLLNPLDSQDIFSFIDSSFIQVKAGVTL